MSYHVTANLHLWIPSDIPKARAYMQYNLAVCYATRGEYDKAMATLALVRLSPLFVKSCKFGICTKFWLMVITVVNLFLQCTQHIGTPLPVHVYFLRLYLDLLEGSILYYILFIYFVILLGWLSVEC